MPVSLGKSILSGQVTFRQLPRKNGLPKTCIRYYCERKGNIKKKETTYETMGKTYNPQLTESKWYDWWESKGYFKPKADGKVFTLLLPPPNVTGTLHLGHAFTVTIQDVFLRWMRMKGENVVWIPGFDHAGSATQVVVEKYLQNLLNVTKHDLGKEEFLHKVSEWRTERENTIIKQMKQMGASVDWTRKYFTMDDKNSEAVTRAFLHLNEKGLIYRHTGLVNWSCHLRSAVSDIEINWEDVKKPKKINVPGYRKPVEFGYMYKIAYRIWEDGSEGDEVVVATTRPETMLGDTAIAFHPNDTRYSHLRNKFVWHPFRKCKIPIIFDEAVNPELGTGALKITPSHSPEDFEISKRHKLETMDVFDGRGVVRKIEAFSTFGGVKRFEVREKVLNELQSLGLYKGKDPHSMVVPVCIRSGDVIEYLTKPQWFLKCRDMYEKVRLAVTKGDVTIEPDYCNQILFEWFRQGKDWNLSRQIWWGHQIPMYECEFGEEKVWIGAPSLEDAKSIASKKFETNLENIEITQDPDVLDTWFSSGILPFSRCGWPKQLSDCYPLGLMETGCDIVCFWVARMLMLGLEITGRVPFPRVILHGMVCDSFGRKMSKTLGNIVLPEYVINGISLEEMRAEAEKRFSEGMLTESEYKLNIEGRKKMFPSGIPECGTDALRLGLCGETIKADRINFDVKVVIANNHFCNKMWQAMIYLIKNVQSKSNLTAKISDNDLSSMDAWILSRLASAVEAVNEGISDFKYHVAVEAMRLFFIKEFCTVYLESTKITLNTGSDEECRRVIANLFTCLETSFRLVSPFMPFVAEELYHCLPKLDGFTPSDSVTVTEFPDAKYWNRYKDSNVNRLILNCLEIIQSIRQSRSLYKLSSQKLKVILTCPVDLDTLFSDELRTFVKKQAALEEFTQADGEIPLSNAIVHHVGDCTMYLYHEHTKSSLQEMFGSLLLEEKERRKRFDSLKSVMSHPDYEKDTSSKMKSENSVLFRKLTEKLKKIDEVKEVIEKAR